jgi:pilus assembly protein CpaC
MPLFAVKYIVGLVLGFISQAVLSEQMLTLSVGQAHVMNEANVKRIAVGNGKILQATALDDKQILIIPEAPGQSTLHVWSRNGAQRVVIVQVVPSDANRLLTEINALLGSTSGASARIVGDKVVLEGNNLSEQTAAKLQEISKRYPNIINLVSKVGVERMIGIDVRMIEIKRDVLQNIGVKWAPEAQGPSFGILGDLQRSQGLQPGGVAVGVPGVVIQPRVPPFKTSLSLLSNITSMIKMLVQSGDAVILAEPRLSCRSGGEAKFIAGGELPIPQSTGFGQVSVSFKEYGVKFEVKPVANDSGMISAKIVSEISSINFDVMIKDVPGLNKRRAETEVNLRENETLVIAGLVTDEMSRNIDRVPALGDVPILGKLFRSKQFRENQTEMVVLITPRFVSGEITEPIGEPLARTPGQAAIGSYHESKKSPDSELPALKSESQSLEPGAVIRRARKVRDTIQMQE